MPGFEGTGPQGQGPPAKEQATETLKAQVGWLRRQLDQESE